MNDSDTNTFEVTQFTCPTCGSHEFEQDRGRGLLCHGDTDAGACTFRCAADDPRYFKGTGRFLPCVVGATAVKR